MPPLVWLAQRGGVLAHRWMLAWLMTGALVLAVAPARADDASPGPAARAEALMDAGRYAEAADLLERAVTAAPGDANLSFLLGVAYGHVDRDADALAAFERAVALDPAHAEAHYNLGALHFKAGRYEAAARAFLAIPPLKPAMAPAAYLNAGLARYRQGRIDEATGLLRRSATGDPEGPAGDIARRMLEYLGSPPGPSKAPRPRPAERPWRFRAGVAREYDSNVLLAPDDPTISTRSDSRVVATLRTSLWRTVGAVRLEPEYSLYARWYDSEDAYDFLMHRFALGAEPARRRGAFRATYSLALTELGDRGYLDIHQAAARLRVLARPRRAAWLEARARIKRAANPQYDYLAGHELELVASGLAVAGGHSLYGALTARRADLGDLTLGPGEFRSYSYLSFSPFLRATLDLGRRWTARLDAAYELRRYRDPDRWAAPAPGSRRREDHRLALNAELELTLAGPVSLAATWRGERVRSNIGDDPNDYADRDYVRNIYGGTLRVAY
jgi:tetratricopeptide (TPR) repeat protein